MGGVIGLAAGVLVYSAEQATMLALADEQFADLLPRWRDPAVSEAAGVEGDDPVQRVLRCWSAEVRPGSVTDATGAPLRGLQFLARPCPELQELRDALRLLATAGVGVGALHFAIPSGRLTYLWSDDFRLAERSWDGLPFAELLHVDGDADSAAAFHVLRQLLAISHGGDIAS